MDPSILQRPPQGRALLHFGVFMLLAFGALAALARWGLERPSLGLALGLAGAAFFLASLHPPLGRRAWQLWMGLGLAIGAVVSPIVLGLIFFLIFTPLALLFRALGRDPLRRRLEPEASTYWLEYPRARDVSRYFKPY